MSTLRRIALFPAGHRGKWIVLVVWLVIAVFAGPVGGKLSTVVKNDQASYLPGDAESTRVISDVTRFPSGQTLPAVVMAERGSGITAADRAALAAMADQASARITVLHGRASAPVPSADGKALLLIVPLQGGLDGPAVVDAVKVLRGIVATAPAGLHVGVGGIGGITADEINSFSGIDGILLIATLIIVIVILLITYRSPSLWIVPLLAVGIAYTLAQAVIYEMAQHAGLLVSGESQGILTVLIFGAGTDYALLLVARYREELTRHDDKHEAMQTALRRALPAVVASASTVVLGLLCLFAASLNSDRGLGPVGAIAVLCTFAALVTALPALLTVFGRRVFWPFSPQCGRTPDPMTSAWGRIGGRIAGRQRTVWVGTSAALVVLGLFTLTLKTGLTNDQAFRTPPDSVAADRLIAQHYPAGESNPADVVATAGAAAAVLQAAQSTPGVASARVAETASGLVRIEATLDSSSGTSAAFDAVNALRTGVHAVPAADARVGGESAIELDVQNAAIHDREIVMPLILLVVFTVLALLLRAVVAPLLLVASVVLSYFAALGTSAILFNHVFGFAGIDQTLPLLGFVFLVALGVDYNIFLMSRVREETLIGGTRRGVLVGVATTGGVITSAGVVLAATFSALGLLPLVFLTEIGVLVAVGVLIDTLVVRSILVPALVMDVGAPVWWPNHLRP
ncbi:MAG: MMPL family transporter [Candidatus Dormibacteraeota bacterium]|nr:MMPL family transporter [Candidatus Dormibacteraeota bacterium]